MMESLSDFSETGSERPRGVALPPGYVPGKACALKGEQPTPPSSELRCTLLSGPPRARGLCVLARARQALTHCFDGYRPARQDCMGLTMTSPRGLGCDVW